MKTKKAEATKKAIVKAASELFTQKSVTKVTISDIVKKAGVAKGTFYLYFESKEDIVWAFIEEEFRSASEWIMDIASMGYTNEAINKFMKYIMDYVRANYKILKIMHNARFYSFLGTKTMEDRYFNRWIIPIQAWIDSGKQRGLLEIEDVDFVAQFVVISIHEMIDRVVRDEVSYTLDDVERNMCSLLPKILGSKG